MNINDSVNAVQTVLLICKIKACVKKERNVFALLCSCGLLWTVKVIFLRYNHLEETVKDTVSCAQQFIGIICLEHIHVCF